MSPLSHKLSLHRMISTNLNQSSLPLKKRSQDQSHLPTTNNNSYPCPVFFDSMEDQDANGGKLHGHQYHQQQQQEKPSELLLINGSSDFLQSFSTNSSNNNDKIDQYFCDGDHDEDGKMDHGSVKWMSSKMQWMRKMMASDQTIMSKPRRSMEGLQGKRLQNQESSSNISSGIIRVCSDCSTTKTPLWRSGPQGPKSLCNACGIRQRKARRAMMAAAGSGLVATNTPTKVQKKRAAGDRTINPSKKQRKITNTGTSQKKLQIDDLMISLSDSSAFHRVFPQDEKDAAILLMALSWGIIHG